MDTAKRNRSPRTFPRWIAPWASAALALAGVTAACGSEESISDNETLGSQADDLTKVAKCVKKCDGRTVCENKCKADADGDGIPNGADACKKRSGPKSNDGCPVDVTPGPTDPDGELPEEPGATPAPAVDTDGDRVPDSEDQCPNEPEWIYPDPNRRGCPLDSDGDGISDAYDDCRSTPGSGPYQFPRHVGCPVPWPEYPNCPEIPQTGPVNDELCKQEDALRASRQTGQLVSRVYCGSEFQSCHGGVFASNLQGAAINDRAGCADEQSFVCVDARYSTLTTANNGQGGVILNSDFRYAKVQYGYTSIVGSDFSHAEITSWDGFGQAFNGHKTRDSKFIEATIHDMGFAPLSNVDFSGATLTNVRFRLDFTSESAAGGPLVYHVQNVNFSGAKLTDVSVYDYSYSNIQWSEVRFLNVTCPDGVNSDTIGNTCVGHGF